MQGTRLRLRPSSGPHFFSLLSVLALLALACFPVLAQAEIQYYEGPPEVNVPGKKDQNQKSEPTAHASGETPNSGGGTGSGNSGGGDSGNGSGNNPSGQSSNPSTGDPAGTGKGSAGNGSTGASGVGAVQQGQPVSTQQAADDSSSPLVPILIAIAVLAAISIGVVFYRQRHQDGDGDGTAVSSPEPS
jgi:cobalamin biosynthesis Mg chelatase CobN